MSTSCVAVVEVVEVEVAGEAGKRVLASRSRRQDQAVRPTFCDVPLE